MRFDPLLCSASCLLGIALFAFWVYSMCASASIADQQKGIDENQDNSLRS